jgi:hypothetical protein
MLGGMDQHLTALERAFQLAESGRVAGVTDIVSTLKHEGYRIDQVQGPQLLAQLRKLIGASRVVEAMDAATPAKKRGPHEKAVAEVQTYPLPP